MCVKVTYIQNEYLISRSFRATPEGAGEVLSLWNGSDAITCKTREAIQEGKTEPQWNLHAKGLGAREGQILSWWRSYLNVDYSLEPTCWGCQTKWSIITEK